ncbi:hypothetical protein AVEN_130364-1 [Araneus ventricosus]|uniref:C2H2-type domain-containing protein n=1 Tax=Araneus ventricosus TaxID=182803 RepID=A0A4Y2BFU2_ARAVE|nr:hypothetical protein AVEN_130364-1 [Araneus ventricosus]
MNEMTVQKDTQKMEEKHLKLQRKRPECIKGVDTKKLRFDSFKKPKFLTLMTSVHTSKENIIQCPACDEIYVDRQNIKQSVASATHGGPRATQTLHEEILCLICVNKKSPVLSYINLL